MKGKKIEKVYKVHVTGIQSLWSRIMTINDSGAMMKIVTENLTKKIDEIITKTVLEEAKKNSHPILVYVPMNSELKAEFEFTSSFDDERGNNLYYKFQNIIER